ELSDGTAVRARVVAHDRKRDLAALEFEPYSAMVAAVVRGSPLLRVGELVIAIGHPGGLVGAATLGIIHAVESEGEGRTPRWIRADMRLAPGLSGGPLADTTGRLVGVNTMMQGGLALAVHAAAVEAGARALRAGARAALPRNAAPQQIRAAVRAAAAGLASLPVALAMTLLDGTSRDGAPAPTETGDRTLTPREREILTLLGDGL